MCSWFEEEEEEEEEDNDDDDDEEEEEEDNDDDDDDDDDEEEQEEEEEEVGVERGGVILIRLSPPLYKGDGRSGSKTDEEKKLTWSKAFVDVFEPIIILLLRKDPLTYIVFLLFVWRRKSTLRKEEDKRRCNSIFFLWNLNTLHLSYLKLRKRKQFTQALHSNSINFF